MVKNLENVSGKFLMYPRFVQVFMNQQLEGMPTHKRIYIAPSHTKKIFGNMRRVGKGFSRRDTPLFQTIVVQDQAEMGEGSANPTDPHHTPTFIKQRSRMPKRKDNQVPQSSGPTDNVADEAVNKDMDDSLELVQVVVPGVKKPWGILLLKLELCTNSQTRILDLEATKTTQANKIASLKRRVKRLEKKRSRTHGLKRLYKVGSSRRVESSKDEGLGEEDASKQGRIADIDATKDIYLVNVHHDEDMFGVNDLEGDEVLVESKGFVKTAKERINVVEEVADIIDVAKSVSAVGENINAAEETVSAASIPVSAAATTVSAASEILTVTTADELTLAQALAELKSARPPTQGISFREPSEATTTTTTTTTITAAPKPPQDKGKGIMIEEPVVEKEKPMKKQEQIRINKELAFKLQAEEEEEESLAREKAQQVEEANIAWDDIRVKIDVDYQLAQRLQDQEQDELTDEEKARLFVQFLEQRRKYFAAKRAEEKRNKPPTRAQQRSIMCTYLKNMEGWKPKSLKNKTELVEESSKKVEAEIAHESSLKRAREELE
ncbi:hypothetical protein Tco_0337530 [Tanacetum coccineum]